MRVLANMADPVRLAKAPPNHLAFTFGQLFKAGRLLRGESTSNVGLRASIILSAHGRLGSRSEPTGDTKQGASADVTGDDPRS